MAGAGVSGPADVEAPPPPDAADLVHRFRVGSLDCTALKDGFITGPTRPLAPEAPVEDLRSLLQSQGDHPDVRYITIANLHVRQASGRGLLVDAGIGRLLGLDLKPILTAGHSARALEHAGVVPDEVETVLVSHIHPDHIGGLFDAEDRPVFPRARYHVSREELAFWDQPDPDLSGSLLPPFVQVDCKQSAKRFLKVAAGRMELFSMGDEVVEGVKSVALPGHTPGQVGFQFDGGGGETLFYTADALANRAVSIQRPDWRFSFDADSPQAIATRHRLLDSTVQTGWPLFTPHFPWPAVGRMVREGGDTRWIPAP